MSEVKDFIGFDDIPNDVILEYAEELCMPTNNGGWSESEGKITLRGEIQLLEIGAIIQVVKSRIPDEKSLVEVVGSDNYDDVVDYAFSLFTGDRDFDELFTFSPGKGGRVFTISDEVDLSFNELEALELILIEKCIEKHIEETGKEDGFEGSYDDFLRCAENWYNQSEDEVESEEIKSEEFDQEPEDSLDSTEDILQGSTNFKYEDLDKSQKRVFDSYFERILSEVEKTSNGRKVNVEAVRAYCLKNFRDPELEFFNNIKEEYFDTTILSLLYLLRFTKSPPLITAFNTLFQNGDRVRNLPGVFLNYLLSERKKVKAEMFEYINTDRAKYNQLDLLQRIIKILANSYYGAFGSKSFIFFNPDIGPSITYQGQQIIITAILGFEGFAGNNVLIEDFNQYFNYIDNIMNEEIDESLQLSGITVSPEDVIKVTDKFCEFEMTKQEKEIIFDRISSASQTRLQKLYFTNNIWEFLQLPEIEDRIINEMICDNYFEADKIPEEIKEPVEWLAKMTRNFVFYVYPHENKTAKATRMRRRAVLLSDTDSTFINGRPFIDRICERKGWLKHELSNKKRCSIICIFTKLVTDYITDTYYNFTTNANVLERDKHRVNMKSEFHYKRIMITTNKKAYAGIVLSKEGKVYDVPPIDIKGLQIRKVTTPKAIREKFANILEHDILGSEIINFKDIYRQFFEIEKGIRDRIAEGDSKLLKPQAIKSIENYKDPISQAGYRGAMLWNYLHPRESISDFSSVHLANFKEKYTIEQLKGLVPDDIYEKLLGYPEHLEEINPNKNKRAKPDDKREIDRRSQYERFGIDCLAIPWDYDKAPEWIEKIVFADKIVNDMIKSGNVLLESIGFTIIDNKRNRDNFESKNASNIVRF